MFDTVVTETPTGDAGTSVEVKDWDVGKVVPCVTPHKLQ